MVVPLIGYLDGFSARPGGRLALKVSSALAGPYEADLVRIRHADPSPAGPGMKILPVPAPWAGRHPSRVQPVRLGSFGAVRDAGAPDLGDAFTVLLRVQPWQAEAAAPRTLLAITGADRALALRFGPRGAEAELRSAAGGAAFGLGVEAPPLPRRWYEIALTLSPGRLRLAQRPLQPGWGAADAGTTETAAPGCPWRGPVAITFAAEPCPDGGATRHFNGRLEDPVILGGAQPDATLGDPEALLAGGAVLAWWDFSQGIDTDGIRDRGPRALHGGLTNLPMRAVRGSRWSGREQCWRHAPRDYAAIHFHEDDIEDCGWDTDLAITIPESTPSGLYGVRLRGGGQEDIVPFCVLAPRGRATAPIAVLASTFTWQAYANHSRGSTADTAYRARRAAWPGAYPHNPDEHPEYGRSTYNRHPDGSGIALSSRLRPILTMRPGFLTYLDARGSGLRHLPADTHLTDWLEEKGFSYDVVTDEDLDDEGVALLAPYRAVLTGSHPEYHTERTLDALQSYVSDGGRLAYLGGNGFYWKIARRPDRPHVIEIRRAEGGIRTWAAEPGEYHHQLDGTYGGLWRRNGRPPQLLAGVGFTAQGLFEGTHYQRTAASHDPRHAWIFEGVEGEILGDSGLSGGGAAGFELDRADPLLGTPPGAVILARSENHPPHHVAVFEELLSNLLTVSGERPADLIRAEIVFFETARGGAVFSVGSITFCGSLSHNGYDNPVSRMLENVIRRFAA